MSVLPIGTLVECFLGSDAKNSWFEKMGYWGHTREHLAPYSYLDYLGVCHDIRNCVSLNGRTWARENDLPTDIVDIGQG